MPLGLLPVPPPRSGTPIVVTIEPARWWRVHPERYGPTQLNSSGMGNARFSPVSDTKTGHTIPTLYAASSLDGALMETILHDVPMPSDGHIYDLQRDLSGPLRVSTIDIAEPLNLVDLTSIGLRRMGLEVSDLFESDSADYSRTRTWAHWFRATLPAAQGLLWISRRDNSSRALVLFGDRIPSSAINLGDRTNLSLSDPAILAAILDLMRRLGVADAGP